MKARPVGPCSYSNGAGNGDLKLAVAVTTGNPSGMGVCDNLPHRAAQPRLLNSRARVIEAAPANEQLGRNHDKNHPARLAAHACHGRPSVSGHRGPRHRRSGSSSSTLETVRVTAQRVQEELEAERAATPGAVTVVDSNELYQRMSPVLPTCSGTCRACGRERRRTGRSLHLQPWLQSRFHGLRQERHEAASGRLPVTTADGNNHNRVIDPLSARYAVDRARRQRPDLWREHARRRHRLHIAHRAHQPAAWICS